MGATAEGKSPVKILDYLSILFCDHPSRVFGVYKGIPSLRDNSAIMYPVIGYNVDY